MKRIHRLILLAGALLAASLFATGCDTSNMSIGIGYSGYSNGVGYSYGVSSGPGGPHGSFGMSMYGHP
jgi:hypothetical protein